MFILDKTYSIIILFLLLAHAAKGQEYIPDYTVQRAFACIVIDKATGEPLEKATLRVGRYGWSADEAGRVETLANIGDTLVFTHVGYTPVMLEVSDSLFSQNIVAVSLSEDTVSISEVLVRPRRLNLSQAIKKITAQETRNNAFAHQSFASGTREALSAPKTWGEWGAIDNQMNTLNKHNRQIEYKGMIPPEQTINLTNIALSAIMTIVKKISARPRHSAVVPLTEEELHFILTKEEPDEKPEP